jgi:hypothetical protein
MHHCIRTLHRTNPHLRAMTILRGLLVPREGPALLEGTCGIGVMARLMSLSELSLRGLRRSTIDPMLSNRRYRLIIIIERMTWVNSRLASGFSASALKVSATYRVYATSPKLVSPGRRILSSLCDIARMVGRSVSRLDPFPSRTWPCVPGKGCMLCRCADMADPGGMAWPRPLQRARYRRMNQEIEISNGSFSGYRSVNCGFV